VLVTGVGRTAEELGRAFSAVPVVSSGAGHVLDDVAQRAALVLATPGAEPVARGGYGAALLLDGWAMLARADLRAAESSLAPVQALIRWDPAWHAGQELAARAELGFPPAMRMASVDGTPDALASAAAVRVARKEPDPVRSDPLDLV
jgi:primosomal protein N' (replication factor Y) (superfamily II helicase)